MTQYVALLRGIGPGNPNMRNEHLRRVAESLGLEGVSTVISSGNIVFRSDQADTAALESQLEEAWPVALGFESTTIIRSRHDLETLIAGKPFGARHHGLPSYLLVTFFKNGSTNTPGAHRPPSGQAFDVVAATPGELFTVSDMTAVPAPDVMTWIEKRYGKAVSSRTWLTVQRILQRMERDQP